MEPTDGRGKTPACGAGARRKRPGAGRGRCVAPSKVLQHAAAIALHPLASCVEPDQIRSHFRLAAPLMHASECGHLHVSIAPGSAIVNTDDGKGPSAGTLSRLSRPGGGIPLCSACEARAAHVRLQTLRLSVRGHPDPPERRPAASPPGGASGRGSPSAPAGPSSSPA